MILYADQDETQWDQRLIAKGTHFLHQASRGKLLSRYHLEASIAYWHTIKADTAEKWESILQLYDQLLMKEYTPVAALNRIFVLSKVKGKAVALAEAEKLRLTDNPFYYTLLGELYTDIDHLKAGESFGKALLLAKTNRDQETIRSKLAKLCC